MIHSEKDIEKLVASDKWMMDVLNTADALNLPDWWIGAGFLRNKVWNEIQGNKTQPPRDVDLVYFDAANVAPETDWAYDAKMMEEFPIADWEVRNQARMHYVNNFEPYSSTAEGIAHWVETATCVAVRLEMGRLAFLYCYGSDDLLNMIARPIPAFQKQPLFATFHDRVAKKQWRERWPNLQIVES